MPTNTLVFHDKQIGIKSGPIWGIVELIGIGYLDISSVILIYRSHHNHHNHNKC